MKLTALDTLVLEAVVRIRARYVATLDRIGVDVLMTGITPRPKKRDIYRSLEILETAEYLKSSLVMADANGDIRAYTETEKAWEFFKLGG